MKRAFIVGMTMLGASCAMAQQQSGKVVYERRLLLDQPVDLGIPIALGKNDLKDMFELHFIKDRSLWLRHEEAFDEQENGGQLVSMQLTGLGGEEVTYYDGSTGRIVKEQELNGKIFIVTDSVKKDAWTITEESRTILGYACRKATARQVYLRTVNKMEDGRIVPQQVSDTVLTNAWFTTEIPVAAGPDVYGQLPGMVLELEAGINARTGHPGIRYVAVDVTDEPDLKLLKEPSKGKKITAAAFKEERRRLFEQVKKDE